MDTGRTRCFVLLLLALLCARALAVQADSENPKGLVAELAADLATAQGVKNRNFWGLGGTSKPTHAPTYHFIDQVTFAGGDGIVQQPDLAKLGFTSRHEWRKTEDYKNKMDQQTQQRHFDHRLGQQYGHFMLERPNWPICRVCTKDKCFPCNRDDDGCFFLTQGATYMYGSSRAVKGAEVVGGVLKSKMLAGSGTIRSEYIIEFRCEHDWQTVKMSEPTYNTMENGELEWQFNGTKHQTGKVVHVSKKRYGSFWGEHLNRASKKLFRPLEKLLPEQYPIKLKGRKGLNTLKLVFTRKDMHKPAEADVAHFQLAVDPGFSKCEDKQACLAKMADGKAWPDGAGDLKQSIQLQHVCLYKGPGALEGPYKASSSGGLVDVAQRHAELLSACVRWKHCLEQSGMLEDVKSMLTAFGAQIAPLLTDYLTPTISPTNQADSKASNDVENELEWGALTRRRRKVTSTPIKVDTKCRDPWVTDPEAWVCVKCDEWMEKICSKQGFKKGSCGFDACLRNVLCNAPNVCKRWKVANCPGKSDCNKAPTAKPSFKPTRRPTTEAPTSKLAEAPAESTSATKAFPTVKGFPSSPTMTRSPTAPATPSPTRHPTRTPITHRHHRHSATRRRRRFWGRRRLLQSDPSEGAPMESQEPDGALLEDLEGGTSDSGAQQREDSLIDAAASVDMGLCAGWGAG